MKRLAILAAGLLAGCATDNLDRPDHKSIKYEQHMRIYTNGYMRIEEHRVEDITIREWLYKQIEPTKETKPRGFKL